MPMYYFGVRDLDENIVDMAGLDQPNAPPAVRAAAKTIA
jgi:hypothetical protein